MNPCDRVRVKICCIQSIDEAWLAIHAGADAIGLVAAMPSGPGPISEEQILHISQKMPPALGTFLLTSHQSAEKIIQQQRRCHANTIQICDALTEGTYEQIREQLPGISIVQVIHVTSEDSIREAETVSPHVDAILLDSGCPHAEVKTLGGTGKTHNWQVSKKIRENISVPLFLAGGLTSHNVVEAIDTVQPFGIDLCNGVRTLGALDAAKLTTFFTTLRHAEKI